MNGFSSDRRRLIIVGAAVVVVAGILYGGWAWWQSRSQVTTDDACWAHGRGEPVMGNVVELLVQDNWGVKTGQVILRLDLVTSAKRDQAAAAVAVAEAALLAARSELPMTRGVTEAQTDEAKGALEGERAAEAASQSAVHEAQAVLEAKRAAAAAAAADATGAKANAAQAIREMERQRKLVQSGLVALRDFEVAETAEGAARAVQEATERRKTQAEREVQQAEASLASKTQGVLQAKQRVAELRGTLAKTESQRGQVPMKEADIVRAEAALSQARADLNFAELQLQYTEVRALVDGVVSRRTVELGQVAQMGQPLLAIVPLHEVWVLANFKETQLARIRPGMPANVWVDTFSDRWSSASWTRCPRGSGSAPLSYCKSRPREIGSRSCSACL
jgi:membrane fusion protein (multidrug efflux system)